MISANVAVNSNLVSGMPALALYVKFREPMVTTLSSFKTSPTLRFFILYGSTIRSPLATKYGKLWILQIAYKSEDPLESSFNGAKSGTVLATVCRSCAEVESSLVEASRRVLNMRPYE